jgi:hypothetical protein
LASTWDGGGIAFNIALAIEDEPDDDGSPVLAVPGGP